MLRLLLRRPTTNIITTTRQALSVQEQTACHRFSAAICMVCSFGQTEVGTKSIPHNVAKPLAICGMLQKTKADQPRTRTGCAGYSLKGHEQPQALGVQPQAHGTSVFQIPPGSPFVGQRTRSRSSPPSWKHFTLPRVFMECYLRVGFCASYSLRPMSLGGAWQKPSTW